VVRSELNLVDLAGERIGNHTQLFANKNLEVVFGFMQNLTSLGMNLTIVFWECDGSSASLCVYV
jgi:hypothetical protein